MILVHGGEKMTNSILNSVKESIGIVEEYTHFDNVLIMHINSVFMILNQIGVGPEKGFSISDETAQWSDFLPEDNKNYEAVKSYVSAKVRLMFDPPTGSVHMECLKQVINELEWRLNLEHESS